MDKGVGQAMHQQLQQVPAWRSFHNPWLPEDDAEQDFSYINLQANPERYTGYEVGPQMLEGAVGVRRTPCSSMSNSVLC